MVQGCASRYRRALPLPQNCPKANPMPSNPAIDRTVKLYIGGKQARPDSGYSMEVRGKNGTLSRRSAAWKSQRHSQRCGSGAQSRRLGKEHSAQSRPGSVLHGGKPVAAPRRDRAPACAWLWERSRRLQKSKTSIERIFSYAAWADKFDGAVHNPPFRKHRHRHE